MNRNQTLDSAKAAVNRAPKSYGNPREHFERVARHWNAHLRGVGVLKFGECDISATNVAIMLGLVKIARLEHDPQHADSWCDLAGYAACGAEVSEPVPSQGAWWNINKPGAVVEFFARPGETTADAADRAMREGSAGLIRTGAGYTFQTVRIVEPPQEPAWKRAKVGDRIRIREGAWTLGGRKLPSVVTVGRVDWRVNEHPKYRNDVKFGEGGFKSVHNDDVLEILPPLPESKFGFTVGETVNYVGCPKGSTPGKVTGFSDVGVNVRWSNGGEWPDCSPSILRHGA